MALGDVDGGLEGCRYGPVNGKKTDEGPEEQSEIYESTDPKNVEPPNRFTVIDATVENRKGQLGVPLRFLQGFKVQRFMGSKVKDLGFSAASGQIEKETDERRTSNAQHRTSNIVDAALYLFYTSELQYSNPNNSEGLIRFARFL
jgi:hypothetical protein